MKAQQRKETVKKKKIKACGLEPPRCLRGKSHFSPSLRIWIWSLGLTQLKDRTNLFKLFSDLYRCCIDT